MDFLNTIRAITDITVSILKRVKINNVGFMGIDISIEPETDSIDERIKKIEVAKKNLIEGLSAIEELEKEASKNQKDARDALLELNQLKADKSSLENEVESIKEVIKSDVDAFKKVAGVPTTKMINKERAIGFVTGILASLITSGLIWLIAVIYQKVTT